MPTGSDQSTVLVSRPTPFRVKTGVSAFTDEMSWGRIILPRGPLVANPCFRGESCHSLWGCDPDVIVHLLGLCKGARVVGTVPSYQCRRSLVLSFERADCTSASGLLPFICPMAATLLRLSSTLSAWSKNVFVFSLFVEQIFRFIFHGYMAC